MTKIEPFLAGYKRRNLWLPVILLGCYLGSQAQPKSISMVDFVQIKNGKRDEAFFFYQNNWKVYRDVALSKGQIKSFKLLVASDTLSQFDIMLITEYADSIQWSASEKNFQKIISEVSPNGPRLLNELTPNDFRKNVFLRQMATVAESVKNEKPKNKKR